MVKERDCGDGEKGRTDAGRRKTRLGVDGNAEEVGGVGLGQGEDEGEGQEEAGKALEFHAGVEGVGTVERGNRSEWKRKILIVWKIRI